MSMPENPGEGLRFGVGFPVFGQCFRLRLRVVFRICRILLRGRGLWNWGRGFDFRISLGVTAKTDSLKPDEVIGDAGDEAPETGDIRRVVFEQTGRGVVEGILRVVVTDCRIVLFVAMVVVFALDEHFRVAGRIFEIACAGEFPAVDGEVPDEIDFGGANGAPLVGVALKEEIEGFLGLVGEDGAGGKEAMFDGVWGGTCAAFWGRATAGEPAVSAARLLVVL